MVPAEARWRQDDGAGCNFLLTGRPLDVVTITVWLKCDEQRVAEVRLCQGLEGTPTVGLGASRSAGHGVPVGPGRVQYPVPAQMTPLGPELLEAAESEEEQKAALEQRNECLRKVSWRFGACGVLHVVLYSVTVRARGRPQVAAGVRERRRAARGLGSSTALSLPAAARTMGLTPFTLPAAFGPFTRLPWRVIVIDLSRKVRVRVQGAGVSAWRP